MFGEKEQEKINGQMYEVWQSPRYEQSKAKALEIINNYESIKEGDFWILKNMTKNGKLAYTGLIISHNGCLKLNDALPENKRFIPVCMELDKEGYGGSLVFTYINNGQGIYEVGEVSPKNCQNAYPYAMALKRCFDRVVLKNSKLAYDGIYSENEAEDFKQQAEEPKIGKAIGKKKAEILEKYIKEKGRDIDKILKHYNVAGLDVLTEEQYGEIIKTIETNRDNKEG